MDMLVGVSPAITAKIEHAVVSIRNGTVGSYFVELSYCPLGSLTITNDGNDEPNMRLHQESHLIDAPRDYVATGWQWFLQMNTGTGLIRYDEWIRIFDEVTGMINDGISQDHGFLLHRNGDRGDNSFANLVVKHFCDYLVIYHNRSKAGLVLVTSNFPTAMDADMFTRCQDTVFERLSESQRKFVLGNIELLYHIYGYWENKSFVPITLTPPPDTMPLSNSLVDDDAFSYHQFGKRAALRLTMNTPPQIYYFDLND